MKFPWKLCMFHLCKQKLPGLELLHDCIGFCRVFCAICTALWLAAGRTGSSFVLCDCAIVNDAFDSLTRKINIYTSIYIYYFNTTIIDPITWFETKKSVQRMCNTQLDGFFTFTSFVVYFRPDISTSRCVLYCFFKVHWWKFDIKFLFKWKLHSKNDITYLWISLCSNGTILRLEIRNRNVHER